MAPEVDPAFEHLVDYVRDNRGFDFTGYKRASLMRRFRKRMQEVGIEEFSDYQDYLQVHPDEFTSLFNTILINVTSFFRDDGSWDFLREHVLAKVVEGKRAGDPIRIWCAGCASGEEAYTLAIVVAETLGVPEMHKNVKIYATDVDEEALAVARSGVYPAKAVAPELQEKYFEPRDDERLVVKQELRRTVIFGRHDLVSDAPISRVDLISCRNTLMYFNAEAQSRIYRNFHFALHPHGYLFLGKSEMLLTRTDMFSPIDLKRRVFERVTRAGEHRDVPPRLVSVQELLRRAVFESATIAQVVVDADGVLVEANSRARAQFRLDERDIGRPFQDLELSYRPLELRSRMDRAASERHSNIETAVSWATGADQGRFLDIEVIPVFEDDTLLGTSITFVDVSHAFAMQNELERSRRELETAYEELQSTVEELETTNEELQSTNEELETTNEELQSTNEELETMNEELQSTNEELLTINTELTDRTGELNETNAFLESILESMQAGVIVLDRELAVESWNRLAEDMWGLREDETRRRNFFGLDIGLPVDQLRKPIRDILDGAAETAEIIVDAVNRRGKPFTCKVAATPLTGNDGDRPGVILLMEAAESQA
jgi:two-component system, chemotaxis family, CheB/CheR fusion protein